MHNSPKIIPIDHNLFRLEEDFIYEWTLEETPQKITIKSGFEFDGASIPEIGTTITWLLPWFETIYPMGKHIYAALIHDFIWKYKGRIPLNSHQMLINNEWVDAGYDKDGKLIWTFTTSNKLFARMLREDGVGKRERRAMFLTVQSPVGYWNWIAGKLPEDARPKKKD